jgi:hypothetical protein
LRRGEFVLALAASSISEGWSRAGNTSQANQPLAPKLFALSDLMSFD